MKIKVKDLKNASTQLIVPIDGLITIDSKGIAEVSNKCAAALVSGTNDWEFVKRKVETEEDEEVDEDENGELSPIEQFKEGLKEMTIKDMQSLAKEAEYPEEEWSNISTKKLLSAYLLSKFEDSPESEEMDEEDEEETEGE